MNKSKQHFLDFLNGKSTKNTLFEPMISRSNTESLIYRRSDALWSTPAEYIKTLLSLAERIETYFAYIDLHTFPREEYCALIESAERRKAMANHFGFGFICYSQDEVDAVIPVADCVCIYGDAVTDAVPVIRMDGCIEDAISRGDSGWFARNDAGRYLEIYGDRIRILGGLGVDFIENSTPVRIYSAVEELAEKYRGKWACGSGGMVQNKNYLEFISMLGAYSRIS